MNRQERDQMYRDVMTRMETLCEHYGADGVPERHRLKAQALLGLEDREEAERIAKRTIDSLQIHLLAQWSDGRIPGPMTRANCEQRAKKAESLANMLEAKGQAESAARQRARAADLRALAKTLKD